MTAIAKMREGSTMQDEAEQAAANSVQDYRGEGFNPCMMDSGDIIPADDWEYLEWFGEVTPDVVRAYVRAWNEAVSSL